MLKKFLKSFCLTTTAFVMISSSALATTGKVTGSKVRIREKADANSPEVSVAAKNETVEIIGEEGNWYKVNFEKVTGYISKDYVETSYSSENTVSTLSSEPTDNVTQAPENNIEDQNLVANVSEDSNNLINNDLNSNNIENTTSSISNETDEVENSSDELQNTNSENTENSEENLENVSNETNVSSEENIPSYQEGQTIIFKDETSLKYLPNFASRELVKAEKDSSYTIISILNNWIKVTNDVDSGWVLKTNIDGNSTDSVPEDNSNTTTDETSTTNTTETTRKGVVNVESAKLRKDPDGETIDAVENGTEVTILGEEGEWYKISVGEYDSCYIAKRLITEK